MTPSSRPTFPRPPGIGTEAFARLVEQAIDRIPEELRACLENVVISVKRRPDLDLLAEMGLPPDEPLFGVYLGTPLTERSLGEPPLYPDTIHIYQEPLEEYCTSHEQLVDEIELTVVHEIAHFFGFTDAELEDLGYGLYTKKEIRHAPPLLHLCRPHPAQQWPRLSR